MRWLLILAFAVLISTPVAAEQAQISHERVSETVMTDWNGDGLDDKAVLVESEDAVDLLIYFSTGPKKPMKLHTRVKDLAWRGAFSGQEPTLDLYSDKSLELKAQNWAIGRYQFESTLTLDFKSDVFRVAGFSYMVNDRLEERAGKCDVDLLTGEGTKNSKAFRTDLRAVPVAEWGEMIPPPSDWKDPKIPAECLDILD